MNNEITTETEATENKGRKVKGLGIIGGILGGLVLGGLGYLICRGKKRRHKDGDYDDDSELNNVELEDDEFEVDENNE